MGPFFHPSLLIFIPIIFSVADAGMNLIEMEGFILWRKAEIIPLALKPKPSLSPFSVHLCGANVR